MSESEVAAVLSAEPLVGLKHRPRVRVDARSEPFSRTPRGFEARHIRSGDRRARRLSAEPLVGLKLRCNRAVDHVCDLSAEPLVGLKQHRAVLYGAVLYGFQPNPSWV